MPTPTMSARLAELGVPVEEIATRAGLTLARVQFWAAAANEDESGLTGDELDRVQDALVVIFYHRFKRAEDALARSRRVLADIGPHLAE